MTDVRMTYYKQNIDRYADERDAAPIRRYIRVTKPRGEDFGSSLCRLDGRIYITDVIQHSCAWKLGLRKGDRLDELNDLTLTGPVSARQVRDLLMEAEQLELTVTDAPLIKKYVLEKKVAERLGLMYMQGSILDLVPSSASSKAKMRTGDSILSVNGEKTTDMSDAHVMLQMNLMFAFEGKVEVLCAPKALTREFEQARKIREARRRSSVERMLLL
eukprot:comp7582_c0_seq1/m.3233 comp7582_c0_seq1/g.3233  ORF comp7582_c0_seq1/g.3233 comp7582_c0_seq1/m.3233 type:complete len:216 (-) comp7582_c0_seq1:619-1266(-)